MHVFQTEGAPPNSGKSIFATSGCTQKRSAALVNKASARYRRQYRRTCSRGVYPIQFNVNVHLIAQPEDLV